MAITVKLIILKIEYYFEKNIFYFQKLVEKQKAVIGKNNSTDTSHLERAFFPLNFEIWNVRKYKIKKIIK